VSLRGDIVAPTGESLFIEGQEIRIPEDPTRKVTKNTTVFLTNASLIDISVIPVGSP
jgi:hypothetical protein